MNPLLSALQKVVPEIKQIKVVQLGGFLLTMVQHKGWNDDEEKSWFGIHQESDSTLRLLGLLTALMQPLPAMRQAPPITVEEPELSLHPGALTVLCEVMRETAIRRQVIITTQSPDLISRFRAEELRVFERVNGATQIGRLDETQREVIERELFSAGDLLRIEGLRPEPVRSPVPSE